MRRLLGDVSLSLFSWLMFVVPTANALDLQLPAGVEVAEVARSMTWNGLPMRIQSFRSDMDIDRVLAAIARTLRDAGVPHPDIVNTLDIKTLGAVLDGTFVNVQGQNRAGAIGSAGYIVYSPMLRDIPATEDAPDFPLTPDISVMSHETYDDGARHGETLLGASPQYATDVARDLVDAFEAEGWQEFHPSAIDVNKDRAQRIHWLRLSGRTCRLLFRDQREQAQTFAVVSVVCHN